MIYSGYQDVSDESEGGLKRSDRAVRPQKELGGPQRQLRGPYRQLIQFKGLHLRTIILNLYSALLVSLF